MRPVTYLVRSATTQLAIDERPARVPLLAPCNDVETVEFRKLTVRVQP
jgi:hypothetical protein